MVMVMKMMIKSSKPQEDNRAVYQLWSSGLLCPKITQALPCTKICQRIYHSNKVHLFRIVQDSKRIYNLKSAPTFVQDSLAMLEQTIKWRLVWQFRSFAFCSQCNYQSRGHLISFSFFVSIRGPSTPRDEISYLYKIIQRLCTLVESNWNQCKLKIARTESNSRQSWVLGLLYQQCNWETEFQDFEFLIFFSSFHFKRVHQGKHDMWSTMLSARDLFPFSIVSFQVFIWSSNTRHSSY